MYCFFYIESHNADDEKLLIYLFFCAISTLDCSRTSQGVREVSRVGNVISSCFLVYRNDQPMLGRGVKEGADGEICKGKKTEWASGIGLSLMPSVYLCLINIPPAFCNNLLHEFSHISSHSNSVLSVHAGKMKENHTLKMNHKLLG